MHRQIKLEKHYLWNIVVFQRVLCLNSLKPKDASEFLKKLSESPYKLYVDDQEFVYIEYYTEKIRYNLARRFMRFSTDSALVYMTYKIVYQVEIDNLKSYY